MNKNNNQKMTIEDLAIITKKGFDEVDKRFDGMNKSVNERFDKIETTINRLPDKAYLGDKLADLEGSVIVRQRKAPLEMCLL